jgi:hypothetical protein
MTNGGHASCLALVAAAREIRRYACQLGPDPIADAARVNGHSARV